MLKKYAEYFFNILFSFLGKADFGLLFPFENIDNLNRINYNELASIWDLISLGFICLETQ